MIPNREILAWRDHAPWASDVHVEQDLLLTRAMVAIFSDEFLSRQVAMRGGTGLHKVHLAPAARCSEDIDLVMVGDASEAAVQRALRRVLAPLGMGLSTDTFAKIAEVGRNFFQPSTIFRQTYAFQPTLRGAKEAKVKVEVNTNERAPHYELVDLPYEPPNLVSGAAAVSLRTYDIDEMLGTKMRALHQPTQGRDLFDLWWALTWTDRDDRHPTDPDRIVAAFEHYMVGEGKTVDADAYERTLDAKLATRGIAAEIVPLPASWPGSCVRRRRGGRRRPRDHRRHDEA